VFLELGSEILHLVEQGRATRHLRLLLLFTLAHAVGGAAAAATAAELLGDVVLVGFSKGGVVLNQVCVCVCVRAR